jgi:hypothetical protein
MSVKGEINNRLTYLEQRKSELKQEQAKLEAEFRKLPFVTDDINEQLLCEGNLRKRALNHGQLISLESEIASLEHILKATEIQDQAVLSLLGINPTVVIDMSDLPYKKEVSANVS